MASTSRMSRTRSTAPESPETTHDTDTATAQAVAAFWRDAGAKRWFAKNETFDTTLKARFEATYRAAPAGHCDDWAETAVGALWRASRPLFYLPLMHSESLADQALAAWLNSALDANTQRFARNH